MTTLSDAALSDPATTRALLAMLAEADAAVAACTSPAEWQALGTEKAGRLVREAVERHNARKTSPPDK